MSAAAHSAGVGVLARSHAIAAAIPRVRPRGTRADLVRAFVCYVFRYYFRHVKRTGENPEA
jgi:hypothetical protein